MTDADGSNERDISCDIALVSVGRKAATEQLGLDKLGISLTARGQIIVDEDFETNIEGIYAIGDVIEGPMLAHKAEEDGVACVDNYGSMAGHVDYDHVPGIVYTSLKWPRLV